MEWHFVANTRGNRLLCCVRHTQECDICVFRDRSGESTKRIEDFIDIIPKFKKIPIKV